MKCQHHIKINEILFIPNCLQCSVFCNFRTLITEGEAFAHTSSFLFFGPTPGFYLELHYSLLDILIACKVQYILKTNIGNDIALVQAVGSAELNIASY